MATIPRIVAAEAIAASAPPEPQFLRFPEAATHFDARAARLAEHAAEHPLGEYLGVIARLARAQQAELDRLATAPTTLPDATTLNPAREHRMPPLAVQSAQQLDQRWHTIARGLADRLDAHLGGTGRAIIDRMRGADPGWLDDQANRILFRRELALDRGAAVFIAGALQVHWLDWVGRLRERDGDAAFGRIDIDNLCPCCGFAPTASILRATPAGQQRYLSCALCAAEWNMVRIKCVTCGSTDGIEYFSIEGKDQWARAETCSKCRTYTKIFDDQNGRGVDALADDLATLALDATLTEQTEFVRSAPNLAFFQGDDASTDT